MKVSALAPAFITIEPEEAASPAASARPSLRVVPADDGGTSSDSQGERGDPDLGRELLAGAKRLSRLIRPKVDEEGSARKGPNAGPKKLEVVASGSRDINQKPLGLTLDSVVFFKAARVSRKTDPRTVVRDYLACERAAESTHGKINLYA